MSESSVVQVRPRHSASLISVSVAEILFVFLLCASAIPVFSVKVPPLVDYPDHLARMYLLTELPKDPVLSQFYLVNWHILPNLAMDIVVPPIVHLFGIFLAGKVFIFLTLTMLATGVQAISYSINRKFNIAGLAVFLFLYNEIFLYGILNYIFGLGLALWAIAAWFWLKDARPLPRALVSLSFVTALFFCHLFALGLYGLVLLSDEVLAVIEAQRGAARPPGWRELAVFALPFAIVPVLLLLSPMTDFAAVVQWKFLNKHTGVYWVIKNYYVLLDVAVGATIVAAAIWGSWCRVLVVHPIGWCVITAGAIVFVAMPTVFFSAGFADHRLPIGILFVVLGFIRWEATSTAGQRAFIGVVVALTLIRLAAIEHTWLAFDRVYADLEQSFQAMPIGARVLDAATDIPAMRRTMQVPLSHAASLATIDRSIFVATNFTHPGKQVLDTTPSYRVIADVDDTDMPKMSQLLAVARERQQPAERAIYWSRWNQDFDFIYVLYTGPHDPNPAPDLLTLVHEGPGFQLYRIIHH